MATRAQKIKVGAFLVFAAAILLAGLLAIGALGWGKERIDYAVYFNESVGGLEVGSPVRYKGFKVGRVERIRPAPLDPDRIEVTIGITPELPVTSQMKATLKPVGITGLFSVELFGSATEGHLLDPGSEIAAEKSLFGTFADEAPMLVRKLDTLLERLNEIFGPETSSKVDALLDDVDDLVTENSGEVTLTLRELREAASSMRRTIDRVDEVVAENRESVSRTLSDLARASGRLDGVIVSLQEGARKAESAAGGIDRVVAQSSPDVRDAIADLRAASRTLRILSNDLKARPSRLIWDAPAEEKEIPDE